MANPESNPHLPFSCVDTALDRYYLPTWPIRIGSAIAAGTVAGNEALTYTPHNVDTPLNVVLTIGGLLAAGVPAAIAAFCVAGWPTREYSIARAQQNELKGYSYDEILRMWGRPHLRRPNITQFFRLKS